MGTLVTNYTNKQHLINELRAGTLDHSCVGNVLYTLHEDSFGEKYIGIAKLSQYEGRWAFKTMDEGMYPYVFTCPKRLLDKSTCTQVNAVMWRASCRGEQEEVAARKSFVKSLKVGDKVVCHGREYTYTGPSNKKGSINVVCRQGVNYRLLTKWVERPE